MKFIKYVPSLAASALVVAALGTAAAQMPACSDRMCFSGTTLSLLVGYGAGGGYDAYARIVAPEIERLSGANVIIRNRPGAGGLLALNEFSSGSPSDMNIAVVNVAAAVTAQGLGTEAVRFDIAKFLWLAGIKPDLRVLLVPAENSAPPWKNPANRSKPVRWAAGAPADEMSIGAALISRALHIDSRIVSGYKGTNEAVLGVIRGEADAVVVSADSARRYAGSRAVRIAAVLSESRVPQFAGTPTLFELAEGMEIEKDWLQLLVELASLGRGFALHPDHGSEQTMQLRAILQDALTDDSFRNRAAAADRPVEYQPPQDLTRLIASVIDAMQRRPDLRHILFEKYY